MKKRDLQDLKTKTKEALLSQAKEIRTDLARITVEANAGRLKDVELPAKKKRDLARILTVIREKELH